MISTSITTRGKFGQSGPLLATRGYYGGGVGGDALLTGIYELFTETPHNTFFTGVGGRLYLNEAPQGVLFPYAVYFLVINVNDFVFNQTMFDDIIIQFNLFSDSESVEQITLLYSYLIALYDWCHLSVVGYDLLKMEREFSYLTKYPTSNVWHYIIDYGILLES